MTSEHCVLLGDVVDSREISERELFQEELKNTLRSINEDYEEHVYANFTVLKGVDEIGGVLTSVSPLAQIQRDLVRVVHPEQIRLAAVVGEIDVNVETREISEMDGRAFARADMLLSEIETEELTFRLRGIDPLLDGLISDEINLLDMIREGWSERKIEVVKRYETMDSQKEVATALNISKQAVSGHLADSKVRQVLQIENRLIDYLQLYPPLDDTDRGRESWDGFEHSSE